MSLFQSTLPLRGATIDKANNLLEGKISIHTPLAGSDLSLDKLRSPMDLFQSTLPLRGATALTRTRSRKLSNFNPHSPCGERRAWISSEAPWIYFNPHSPCGERLASLAHGHSFVYFNPHSPCGERLGVSVAGWVITGNFNPHSPCGERPQK